jgi:16S rRNA (uracil1498-N3)-methyltransferase
MKRFILNQMPGGDGKIRLTGEDYHYLVRVRRLAPGEVFPALLPGGGETLVRVLSVEGGLLTGICGGEQAGSGGEKTGSGGPRLPPLILFQALPKAGKMDLIVRQAAEGGISEIVPFYSDYSIPRPGSGEPENRLRRWEKIIREARQQSGSSVDTVLKPPLNLAGLLDYWETLKSRTGKALGFLFHQTPLEQTGLHEYLGGEPNVVVLAIGPEGGFSPGEVSRFLAAGFKPLTIGDTVLRTETAALYGAAAVRIILLESASWLPKTPPSHGNPNGSG